MDITVKSKNCDVPGRLKDEAVERVERATRFFDRVTGVEMVFSEEANPRIPEPALVELTARTKGHQIRAEGCGQDHRGAMDAAVTRLERQLARYKTRLVDRKRGKGAPPVATDNGLVSLGSPTPEADPGEPRIVRTKQFELVPMLPDDAATHLELLGHDFYLFTNSATGQCNVVYRRKDGDLGLIEPAP